MHTKNLQSEQSKGEFLKMAFASDIFKLTNRKESSQATYSKRNSKRQIPTERSQTKVLEQTIPHKPKDADNESDQFELTSSCY